MSVLFRESLNAVDECVWMTYEQVLEWACCHVGQNVIVCDPFDDLQMTGHARSGSSLMAESSSSPAAKCSASVPSLVAVSACARYAATKSASFIAPWPSFMRHHSCVGLVFAADARAHADFPEKDALAALHHVASPPPSVGDVAAAQSAGIHDVASPSRIGRVVTVLLPLAA